MTTDFNADAQEGAGFPQMTIFGGLRVSSRRTTSIRSAARATTSTVIPNALACSLVLDGDRCTGVKLRVGKTEQVVEAREVILCGGAIGSPQLLMLSGIGAGAELQAAGVEPRHELRGVGKHLEDHLLVYPQWRTKRGANKPLSRLGVVGSLFQHIFAKRGNLTRGPVEGARVREEFAGGAAPRRSVSLRGVGPHRPE